MMNVLVLALLPIMGGGAVSAGTATGTAAGCYGKAFSLKHAYAKQGTCQGTKPDPSLFVVVLSTVPFDPEQLARPARNWSVLESEEPASTVMICSHTGGPVEYTMVFVHGGGMVGLAGGKFTKKTVSVKDGRVTGAIQATAGTCSLDVTFETALLADTPAGQP